jgi:hypothetical protein
VVERAAVREQGRRSRSAAPNVGLKEAGGHEDCASTTGRLGGLSGGKRYLTRVPSERTAAVQRRTGRDRRLGCTGQPGTRRTCAAGVPPACRADGRCSPLLRGESRLSEDRRPMPRRHWADDGSGEFWCRCVASAGIGPQRHPERKARKAGEAGGGELGRRRKLPPRSGGFVQHAVGPVGRSKGERPSDGWRRRDREGIKWLCAAGQSPAGQPHLVSQMRESEFIAVVDEVILPVLKPHGFRRVKKPDGWITPEVLLESNNRWFGASWDWRDRYLDAGLGRLFLFRDVLPRVIVRGPLSDAETNAREGDGDFLRRVLGRIAHRLPDVLDRFDELYPQSIAMSESTASPDKAVRKPAREFAKLLGTEITLEQWNHIL